MSRILEPFPKPPKDVLYIIFLVELATNEETAEEADVGAHDAFGVSINDLARSWDPAGLPPQVRQEYWQWLDQIATWFNATYAWLPSNQIPPCWPQHPWMVAELATLAMSRWAAFRSTSPIPAEEWHQHSVPRFLDRLHDRRGNSSAYECTRTTHKDWPAQENYDRFLAMNDVRQQLFVADVDGLSGTKL